MIQILNSIIGFVRPYFWYIFAVFLVAGLFTFTTGCGEKVELVPAVSSDLPVYAGRCSFSHEIGCRSCLYTYQGRFMILCDK